MGLTGNPYPLQMFIAIAIWCMVFGMLGFLVWLVIDHRRYWRKMGWGQWRDDGEKRHDT